jgi:hypothetical protein
MTPLDLTGIAACCLLLVLGVFFASHERHPLDLLAGGALASGSLTGIAMIAQLKHILLAWFILAGVAACCCAIYLNLWGRRKAIAETDSVNSPT